MAIRDQKLYLIGRPEVPVVDTSVYLDFEGDPERGLVYLIGALVSRQGVTTHHSFWADSHNDVPGMLDDLHQLLVSLGSFCAFSYGSYESACLRSLALHDKGKKLFELIQPRLTNVLSIIYKHVCIFLSIRMGSRRLQLPWDLNGGPRMHLDYRALCGEEVVKLRKTLNSS